MKTQEIPELIKKARTKISLNQADFAKELNKTQSVLSRYEGGKTNPPSEVIMHCMHILNNNDYDDTEEIVKKIRSLKGPKYAQFREGLRLLLSTID